MIDVYKGAKINHKDYPIYPFELNDNLNKLFFTNNLKLDEYGDITWDKSHKMIIDKILHDKNEKFYNECNTVLNTLKTLIEKENCITLIGD